MNIIINNCKQTIKITTNLLKNSSDLSRRYATSIADYKITWVRPEKVSPILPEKSGDMGINIEIKPSDLCEMYSESPEIKDASNIVKKMFTLQYLPNKETIRTRRNKIMKLVHRYESDRKSPEAIIAFATSEILRGQEYLEKHPRNSRAKTYVKEMIDKRKKWLSNLRKWDYRRFEWILEKLNLVYKPIPSGPTQITRKESFTRLTEKYCDKIVQDKLTAYKKELEDLQKDFYKEKAEKLAFIREEELACGLPPSVSEEDIEYVKQKAKECQM
ncbi:small ribosomal subunit protein uS15m [Linepithema humile]|uniref:small ribosomal subunit protein uS15m n=1 Tax=Linepithema humile TaxID=83485 RepID=UPI0006235EB5|nr:PREDICTED: 28S ribosomal protein S15, mitochondrial [Linepithema humile]XP_012219283.1 PREDICTED: 28S ribosomal protein S15, mitochondrial [Linepithema humile]XP_012219284.1 PREDICTED: 28S ribosomal protein S15, mitochondrial [Linepithema humile]